jgi:hypothetical protein
MLGGSSRTPAAALAAVALCAVGCADLIGLDDLEGSGGTGGSAAPGSGGAGSGSGGEALGGSSSCALDQFNDAELTRACWTTFNESLLFGGEYIQNEEEGVLDLRPRPGRAWHNDDSSFLLYRTIAGNVMLEAELSVFGGATGEEQPYVQYADGGLLAFPASQPLENLSEFDEYYAIKAGSLGENLHLGFKGEYTSGGGTSIVAYETPAALSGMSLRICRYNSVLWTGYRLKEETVWHPLHANEEDAGYDTSLPGLPALEDTMYVGLIAEIWDGNAMPEDARMIYSVAQFSVPKTRDDCHL